MSEKNTPKIILIRPDFLGKVKRVSALLACICALAVISGCSFPDFANLFKGSDQDPQNPTNPTDPPPTDPPPVDTQAIASSAEQIVLQWDAPADATIARYDVFFRVHGAADWTFLGQAPTAAQPEYTVLHSILGNGNFDFAVASVNAENQSSVFHTSLDATAQPSTGWYIAWQI
jgi:hypothetical protein